MLRRKACWKEKWPTYPPRKSDHLDLATSGNVAFKSTTTLLECVRFVHDALPEMASDEIDTSSRVLGKTLRAPILIAAMTGGTERAERINRELAALAEERGYAFGLGSQRAMMKKPETRGSYVVRDVAPTALLLGNIGGVQAAAMTTDAVRELVESVGADALCVHLNPAMEVVQPDGDRDFRGVLDTLGAAESGARRPGHRKGDGLRPLHGRRSTAQVRRHSSRRRLGRRRHVVGRRRSRTRRRRSTAARRSVPRMGHPHRRERRVRRPSRLPHDLRDRRYQQRTRRRQVASPSARPPPASRASRSRSSRRGGRDGARRFFDMVELELRTTMLLTGSRTLDDLRRAPRLVIGDLAEWLRQTGG